MPLDPRNDLNARRPWHVRRSMTEITGYDVMSADGVAVACALSLQDAAVIAMAPELEKEASVLLQRRWTHGVSLAIRQVFERSQTELVRLEAEESQCAKRR